MSKILDKTAQLHGLDDEGWRRHANLWSLWTRLPILPLMVLVIWFRDALGLYMWAALGLLAIWAQMNPRFFAPAKDFNNWGARAVLGERFWIGPAREQIAPHHRAMIQRLIALQFIGVALLIYGLWVHHSGASIGGLMLTVGGKLWFLDRMVWLSYEAEASGQSLEIPPVSQNSEDPA